MNNALVVLSGGQDSTTCLHVAIQQGYDKVFALTFDYGQRHVAEVRAAAFIAGFSGINDWECVNIPNSTLKSTSPLTDPKETLETYTDAKQMAEVIGSRVEKTFVPMRNTLFLTIAANRAVDLGCRDIYTGVCQEDNANYPDCTREFINCMEDTINQGLGTRRAPYADRIRITTPLMYRSKKDTVDLAFSMPDCWRALMYSHTSYDGEYPPTSMNHANVLRADGFQQAGLPDPLILRAWNEGRMKLPETMNYRAELVVENCNMLRITPAFGAGSHGPI